MQTKFLTICLLRNNMKESVTPSVFYYDSCDVQTDKKYFEIF